MSNVKLSCQQYRLSIGRHNRWQNKIIGNQKEQDHKVLMLANRPGRHAGNWQKQEFVTAAVQLVAMLTVVENRSYGSSVSLNDNVKLDKTHSNILNSTVSLPYFPKMAMQNNILSSLLILEQKHTLDCHKLDTVFKEKKIDMAFKGNKNGKILTKIEDPIQLATLSKGLYSYISSWISITDPLKFPSTEATSSKQYSAAPPWSQSKSATIESQQKKTITPMSFSSTHPAKLSPKSHVFIHEGLNTIKDFYFNYSIKYPDLLTTATTILQQEIKKRFEIVLDPNTAHFVQFPNVKYLDLRVAWHYGRPNFSNTLTSLLFTNFPVQIQDQIMHIDETCGIYIEPIVDKYPLDKSIKVDIKPSEFIKLVWDIKFYNYIKKWSMFGFEDENIHIKKYFYDFMLGLQSSSLNDEEVKNVLRAVGLVKDNDVNKARIFLFDIDKEIASTLFVFTNDSKEFVTLYLPNSREKFISFQNEFKMRAWFMNICSSDYYREMIAAHFNLISRKKRINHLLISFKEGIDLKNRIFTQKRTIKVGHNFFTYLFDREQIKRMSNYNAVNELEIPGKSNDWKSLLDFSSSVPISINRFLPLLMRLENVIEANNYDERIKDWNRIKHNRLNVPLIALLDYAINDQSKDKPVIHVIRNKIEHMNVNIINKIINTSNHIKKNHSLSHPNTQQNIQKLITIEDDQGKSVNLFPIFPSPNMTTGDYTIITEGIKAIKDFYSNYSMSYPDLTTLATNLLHDEIKKNFHIELDPNAAYFMQFDDVMYIEGKKLHYEQPTVARSLTSFLFTNFPAEVQDRIVDADAMRGIYKTPKFTNLPIDTAYEINIKPSAFIKLIWDINFYNYAKEFLLKEFNDENIHVKKYFYDFMLALQLSSLNNEEINEVLMAVGLRKGNENNTIKISLLDINGYVSSTLFVFTNYVNHRVTLYLPESNKKKFVSFHDESAMRDWIVNSCKFNNYQEMIASHFTIALRQDGKFYDGIDSWLKYFVYHKDSKSVILTKNTPVTTGKNFFLFWFDKIKIKQLADLDYLINSDSVIRRDMWESMIDASNIIPNPISPFLSLAMHLEHAIDAKNYNEKIKEWKKIEFDALNLSLLVLLDVSIRINTNGYEFIGMVEEGINNAEIRKAEIQNSLINKEETSLSKYLKEEMDSNCIRLKRGTFWGKLCSDSVSHSRNSLSQEGDGNNLELTSNLDNNSNPASDNELRVFRETRAIAREWYLNNNNEVSVEQNIDVLTYLASKIQDLPTLTDYVESGSEGINRFLRDGTDTAEGVYQQEASTLSEEYQNLHDYNDFSYRVMLLPVERLNAIKIADVVADKGFSSSSALINNAKSWITDGFIKQYKMPGMDYAVIVYDKSVGKKIAGTDFLVDHILVYPGTKLKINGIETINTNNEKIWFLAVTAYTGSQPTVDIFSGQLINRR